MNSNNHINANEADPNKAAVASARGTPIDYAASALSSPSDEQKEISRGLTATSSIPSNQQRHQQHEQHQHHDQRQRQHQQQQKEIVEGYHSVPVSGNAQNVGFGNLKSKGSAFTPSIKAKISNNNSNNNVDTENNLQTNSKQSACSSFVTAMEQEQHQAFDDYYSTYTRDSVEFSSKLIRAASSVTTVVWRTVVRGDSPASRQKIFVQACYLGVAAIFGTLVRLVLAQIFGQACSNPDSVGWIADEAVLCVTSNGQTTQNEGIIFADLPANLLGSFIMGLLQDGATLGLAINLPVAFVHPSHIFQSYDIWHLALKTGFCGSLTTFSAWNSEMVVLMVGHHEAMPNRHSMVWRALFGYVIGMETAIGSYVFGRTVACWLHKWINPELAKEQKEMSIRERQHGIAINRELPVVERRYLHGLFEKNGVSHNSTSSLPPTSTLTCEELAPLYNWRESTREARRIESGLSTALVELETALIVRKEVLTQEQRDMVVYHGWDIDGLQEWLSERHGRTELAASLQSSSSSSLPSSHLTAAGVSKTFGIDDTVWYAAPAAGLLLTVCLVILLNLITYWDAQTSYENTYRTMAYSMLFAPPGALLRWKLSVLNGKLCDYVSGFQSMSWLPIGTLAANVLGAMVSISMIGWEYNLEIAGSGGFWRIATVRAIKIGFSGCLSTVSTFVSEVHKLTQIRQDRGYKYILITLILSAIAGMVLFVIIV
uniref:Fluoride ion transporter CrcB n=1 Tax=Pseudo-nitzschia australis TaxID=44445 RepID=A0A7S4AX49_9STRA